MVAKALEMAYNCDIHDALDHLVKLPRSISMYAQYISSFHGYYVLLVYNFSRDRLSKVNM